ncbi:hypothetical protein [Desulforhopalus singaporensis]|uniref:Uncharacterized protein n=1 Tax=Desulforhopalus singaporensis TaxID=91360 RepID=A0A1H0SRP9_9BACT|nr:hypothetical protein [Desulforhopalus singaporensis]SDP44437.1 hypothetical protein SAMN05660330_02793 [Desulforhopalus singaporensis]
MKMVTLLSALLLWVAATASAHCPLTEIFFENGWIIHNENDFEQILQEKLVEFREQIGNDLVFDHAEYYRSDYSHDCYLIMRVVIWDRVSTPKDEMWGDVAFTHVAPCEGEYVEVRWYDPVTGEKHIAYNPKYVCCCTTKIPLAYNTIF